MRSCSNASYRTGNGKVSLTRTSRADSKSDIVTFDGLNIANLITATRSDHFFPGIDNIFSAICFISNQGVNAGFLQEKMDLFRSQPGPPDNFPVKVVQQFLPQF